MPDRPLTPGITHIHHEFRWWRALVLAALLLPGCFLGRRESATAPVTPIRLIDMLRVPGTYATGTSCGQEGGDEVFLTILPNHVFSLRQTYRDSGCRHLVTLVFLGDWAASDDGRRLTLDAGPPWLRELAIVNAHTLRAPSERRNGPGLFRVDRDPGSVRLVDLRPFLHPSGLTLAR